MANEENLEEKIDYEESLIICAASRKHHPELIWGDIYVWNPETKIVEQKHELVRRSVHKFAATPDKKIVAVELEDSGADNPFCYLDLSDLNKKGLSYDVNKIERFRSGWNVWYNEEETGVFNPLSIDPASNRLAYEIFGRSSETPHITAACEVKVPRASMKVRILGTGNARSPNNSSFIIYADRPYLVDHPPNLENMLKENGLTYDGINDLIVTHAHEDHSGNLQRFLLAKQGQKVNLYCTLVTYNNLHKRMANVDPYFKQAFVDIFKFHRLHPLGKAVKKRYPYDHPGDAWVEEREPPRTFNNGQIRIDSYWNTHSIPTIGFKLTYNGKVLAYSGDCRFDEKSEEVIRYSPNFQAYLEAVRERDKLVDEVHELLDSPYAIKFGEKYTMYRKEELDKAKQRANLLVQNLAVEAYTHRFSDCDMIIHEASLPELDPGIAVHTDIAELDKLPEAIKQKMFLTHLPPGFTEAYKGSIPVLQEGRVYRI